jgi:N-acetylmuramoyl-L-alanine amidase
MRKTTILAIAASALLAILCGYFVSTVSVAERIPVQKRGNGHPVIIGTVCLDPGHPSEVSSGRVVQNGMTELATNWSLAIRIKQILEANHVKVVMTKHNVDEFKTNAQRAAVSNSSNAGLLFRIHCDTGRGSGISFYYPDRESSKNGIRGPSSAVRMESKKAAVVIHGGTLKALNGKLRDNGVLGESRTLVGRKQGALTGSIYSKTPVVLVEMVFLSNKTDAEFIKSESGKELMDRSLSAGIIRYFQH